MIFFFRSRRKSQHARSLRATDIKYVIIIINMARQAEFTRFDEYRSIWRIFANVPLASNRSAGRSRVWGAKNI